MRSPDKIAIAVRKPNNKISLKKEPVKSVTQRFPILKKPFLRGVVVLFETLVYGIKALNYSANEAVGEDEEKITKKEMFWTTTFAFALALGLFVALPLFLTKLLNISNTVTFNLVDGVIKVLIFIGYLVLITLMKDVRTMFQYHGAEHMAVHCYEAGEDLVTKNVKKFPPAHPRCGTAFLLIVLLLSIFVFAITLRTTDFIIGFIGRIALLPLIAGISYEFLRFSARFEKNFLMKLFVVPGLWLQALTTRKPTERQMEVAIKALKGVL